MPSIALVVVPGDLLAHLQEGHGEPVPPGHLPQRLGGDDRVPLHHEPLFVRQPPRLEEDLVRHPDLADVMERGAARQHLDERRVDLAGEAGKPGRLLRQAAAVVLQPQQMPLAAVAAAGREAQRVRPHAGGESRRRRPQDGLLVAEAPWFTEPQDPLRAGLQEAVAAVRAGRRVASPALPGGPSRGGCQSA